MSERRLFFLDGDESFLIEEAVKKITVPDGHEVLNLPENTTPDQLGAHIATVSLFAGGKTMRLRNPKFLFGKLSDAEQSAFDTCLDHLATSAHQLIVYIVDKKLDSRRKQVATLKKRSHHEHFASYKDWEQDKCVDWIMARVRNEGKHIDRNAAWALEAIGGSNLRHLASEISKAALYVGSRDLITEEDIHCICAGDSISIYHYSEALKTKNQSQAMAVLWRLLKNGEDPIRLLGVLTANIRLYYQLMCLKEMGQGEQQMGRQLGKNPYYLKRLIGDISGRFPVAALAQAMHRLHETDLAIKSGRIKPKTALELLTLELVTA